MVQQPPNPLPANPTNAQITAWTQSLVDYIIQLMTGNLTKGAYVIGHAPAMTIMYTWDGSK